MNESEKRGRFNVYLKSDGRKTDPLFWARFEQTPLRTAFQLVEGAVNVIEPDVAQ